MNDGGVGHWAKDEVKKANRSKSRPQRPPAKSRAPLAQQDYSTNLLLILFINVAWKDNLHQIIIEHLMVIPFLMLQTVRASMWRLVLNSLKEHSKPHEGTLKIDEVGHYSAIVAIFDFMKFWAPSSILIFCKTPLSISIFSRKFKFISILSWKSISI